MPQRNTEARKAMLKARRAAQLARVSSVRRMTDKERAWLTPGPMSKTWLRALKAAQ